MRTALAILVTILAYFIGTWTAHEEQPSCPAEDSCFADYANGQWSIIEGSRTP